MGGVEEHGVAGRCQAAGWAVCDRTRLARLTLYAESVLLGMALLKVLT